MNTVWDLVLITCVGWLGIEVGTHVGRSVWEELKFRRMMRVVNKKIAGRTTYEN